MEASVQIAPLHRVIYPTKRLAAARRLFQNLWRHLRDGAAYDLWLQQGAELEDLTGLLQRQTRNTAPL